MVSNFRVSGIINDALITIPFATFERMILKLPRNDETILMHPKPTQIDFS